MKNFEHINSASKEEKQKEILDPIYYATRPDSYRDQTALITSEKYVSRTLSKLKQH